MPAHHSGGLMLDPRNDIAEGDATGCHAQWPQPAGLPCTDGTADRGGKPLVSCLCVTRGRVALLRRSVACFLSQTYTPCELVIVYGADDLATRDFVGTLNSPWIRGVAAPELTLARRGTWPSHAVAAAMWPAGTTTTGMPPTAFVRNWMPCGARPKPDACSST